MDLVIVPMVVCDNKGNRIGMGGGYYDRSFAFKRKSSVYANSSKPYLLGVAYNLQMVDTINPQAWDVRLDQIITV